MKAPPEPAAAASAPGGVAEKAKADPGIAGLYKDKNHPNGYRKVIITADNAVEVTGHDESAFPAEPAWTAHGTADGRAVTIDLSPRGGGTVDAIFDGTNLVFVADGNAWTRMEEPPKESEPEAAPAPVVENDAPATPPQPPQPPKEGGEKQLEPQAEAQPQQEQKQEEQEEQVPPPPPAAPAGPSPEEVKQLKGRVAELENKARDLEQQVGKAQQEKTDSQSKLDEANGRITQLTAEKDNARVELTKKIEELASVATSKDSLSGELNAVRTTLSEETKRREETEKRLGEIKQELDSKAQLLSQSQDRTQTLETSVAQLESSVTDLRSKLADLSKSFASTQEDRDALRGELEDIHTKHNLLQIEYEEVREQAENPDVLDALSKRSSESIQQLYQTNPAIAAAVNKTMEAVYPTIVQQRLAGAAMLNQTHRTINDNMKAYVSGQYLPMVSGFLVYGLVFIPLFLSFWCLASVQAILRLRPMLNFLHLYFCLVSTVAAGAIYFIQNDPLTVFQAQDPSTYLFFQGLMFLLFLAYGCMMLVALCGARNTCELLTRLVQLGAIIFMASIYMRMVWEPAMLDQPPKLLFPDSVVLPYAASATVFAVIMYLEQVQRRRVAEDPTVRVSADDDTFRITVDYTENQTPGASSSSAASGKRE